jgi:hypothetical protein
MGPEIVNIPHDPFNNHVLNYEAFGEEGMKLKSTIPLDKKNPNTYVSV